MSLRFKSIIIATVLLARANVPEIAVACGVDGKGLKFGLNYAEMIGGDADPRLTPRTGVSAGAFMTLGMNGVLSVQPEIHYVQKGAEYESGPNPREYHYSYVEIPLLLKLTIADRGAAFRPNVYVGPFIGIKTGAKIETYLDPRQEESVIEDLPFARGIDAGYAAGAGADIALGSGRVLVDIRYGRSLVDAVTTGADIRHSVTSVFMGYTFD